MRLARVDGRAAVVTDVGGLWLHDASRRRFPDDLDLAIGATTEIAEWWSGSEHDLDPALSTVALADTLERLGPPVARPTQVFAIGVNYHDHAAETGRDVPSAPLVFTKFPSSLAGPAASVALPTTTCDWEVELVAIVGSGGRDIPEGRALDALAGFCVGQDISERTSQRAGSSPQFSLAKSFENFAPLGPWLTTLDELADPLDLAIECHSGDEILQSSRTSLMVFDVPTLVAYLSTVCELRPGDVIFTGTPDGVGFTRTPPRALQPGMVVESTIEGLGRLRNRFVAASR